MPGEALPEHVRIVTVLDTDDSGRQSRHAANLACLLADAQRPVLIFDFSARGPRSGVHASLAGLPSADISHTPEVRQNLATLGAEPSMRPLASRLQVRRYVLPIGQGAVDVLSSPTGLPANRSASFVANTRSALDRTRYHVVILTGLGQDAPALADLAVRLGDVTVVCFPFDLSGAGAGGRKTRHILGFDTAAGPGAADGGTVGGESKVGGDLVPVSVVPTGLDPTRTDQLRDIVHETFWSAAGMDPASASRVLEIAPPPIDAAGVLAVYADGVARSAYAELGTATGGGAAVEAPPVPPAVERRYLRRFGGGNTEPETVWLASAPAARPWAEWITAVLEHSGITVRRVTGDSGLRDAPAPTVVIVASAERLPEAVRRELDALRAADPSGDAELIQASPESYVEYGQYPQARPLHLGTTDEALALARLRAQFFLPDSPTRPPELSPSWPARLPTALPDRPVLNSPPPNRDFVGREQELGDLRDALVEERLALLTGPAGSGKRELVNAYVRRFGFDYDVVWWIPAHDPSAIRESLRQLDEALVARFQTRAAADPLATLAADDLVHRWLLIYQNADDLSVLDGLLPTFGEIPRPAGAPLVPGTGHVLVVSRAGEPADLGARFGTEATRQVSLAELSNDDAMALLARQLPLLSPTDADAICQRLRPSPVAIRLASATLRVAVPGLLERELTGAPLLSGAVQGYLAELDVALDAPHDLPQHEHDPVDAALRVTLRILGDRGQNGRLAAYLARMCAFVSPDGVSLTLLRERAMLKQLARLAGAVDADELVRDSVSFEAVLWLGVQHGLFEVDWDPRIVRMHRMVQARLRDIMPPHELAVVQSAVLSGLAESAPSDAELENQAHRERLGELRRHLRCSGAVDSSRRRVRHWLVKQIQFAARYGDEHERRDALAVVEEVHPHWQQGSTDKDLRLRLDEQHAGLHWELKEFDLAVGLQEQALQQALTLLGPDHVRTLLAARSLARYLTGTGRFTEARISDNIAYEGFRRILGIGNPNTLWAANNLAFSTFLVGDVREAARLQERVLLRWVEQSGWASRNAWRTAADLGMYLREMGRYTEAVRHLDQALKLAESTEDGVTAPHLVLRVKRNQRIIQRLTGVPLAGRRHAEMVSPYLAMFGADHPEILACQFALAADERETGNVDKAAVDVADAVRRYHRALPAGHPYLFLAQTNLSAFQLAAGMVGPARQNAEEALHGLRERVGREHPWVFAATVNRLATLVGDPEVTDLDEQLAALVSVCGEMLTTTHPYTRVAVANQRGPNPSETIIIDVPSF